MGKREDWPELPIMEYWEIRILDCSPNVKIVIDEEEADLSK